MTATDLPIESTPVEGEAPVQWLDADEQAAWRAFLHMHARLMAQLGRELFESSGLSNADHAVLVQVSEQPAQRVRVLELARALQWEKSRLSHQLTRMQQRGLLERSSCPEDRRGAVVVLTADGRAALDAVAPDHVRSVRRYMFDSLDPEQLAAFAAVCSSVLARLPQAELHPDGMPAACDSGPTGDC